MGGNAFDGQEGVKISRLSPADYHNVKNHVVDLIKPYCLQVQIPFYIQEKSSFGDIDVLYVLDESKIDATSFLILVETEFKSQAKVKLYPGSFSFHFNADILPKVEAQVDLMRFPDIKQLEFAHFYMSHSDFGSIVGQLCTCYGYTFTDTKLMIKVFYNNDPARMLGKITLTDVPAKVCEFLGYDYDTLCKPFQTEHEFFEFMTESSLFNPNFFRLQDSFNHTHRTRAAKRQVYMRFLDYVHKKFEDNLDQFPTVEEIDRASCKEMAAKMFSKLEEYNNLIDNYARGQAVKQKINGGLVQLWIPEFASKQSENRKNGKHLGEFIKHIRNIYNDDELLGMDDEVLKDKVKTAFVEFRKSIDW